MDFNTIAMILGAAVFVLPVVYMLGYARREQQHGKTAKECEENVAFQRHTLLDLHRADLAACELAIQQERNVVRELEISLLKAGEAIELSENNRKACEKQWKYADNYRKAVVNYLVVNHLWDFDMHKDDPMLMIAEIIKWETMIALDPAVSKAAKNLHTRGVRKGAKAGREQMRKLMQKCIDNQAATIRHYDVELTNANKRRMRFTEAVTNVLNDKIALPGVRRSIVQSIIQEHDRLRAVADKKGE